MKDKITWTVLEYEHREKTPDWFWALAIVAIAGSIAAIIHKNYLLAIFIILATFLMAVISLRKPQEIEVELNTKGVCVDSAFYPYKNLKSFFVHEKKLLLHSNRPIMPIITLHLRDNFLEERVNIFLEKYLKEEEMEEPFSHRLMELLGF